MNATLAVVGELCWQIAKLSILGVDLRASLRLPTCAHLHNLGFVEQLTVVGNVTMQLSNVTVSDNCKAVYINVVN